MSLEDDEIMTSFEVNSLYTNVPITDTLNIIKNCVNNDDPFTGKKAIQVSCSSLSGFNKQLVHNSQFYQQTYVVTMEDQHLHSQQVPLHSWNVREGFADDNYSILKGTYLENFFNYINNIYQNIKFILEECSNVKLAFRDPLLKRNNDGKIFVLVCRKSKHADHSYCTALTTNKVVRKVLFTPCLIEHIPLSPIKMA